MPTMELENQTILLLRKTLLLARGVPGYARLVNPVRRRFSRTPRVITVHDFDGDLSARLELNERMQSQIFWYGYCSRDICAVLKRILKPGMVVVDAGANIGEVTLISAKVVGPQGRVFAFEPVGRIADHLADNVRMNDLSQVRTVRYGLADISERRPIYRATGRFRDGSIHDGLGTLYPTEQRSIAAEEVPLTTLDDFIAQSRIARLDMVKLDVEGAELAALRGARSTLQRFKPYLIIEVQQETARAAGYEAEDILRLLKPLGYRFDIIGRKGRLTPVDEFTLRRFQNVLCTPVATETAALKSSTSA